MSNKPRFKSIAAGTTLDRQAAEPFLRYHYMDDLSVSFRDAARCLDLVMMPAVVAYLQLRVASQALGRISGDTGRDMPFVAAWNRMTDASLNGQPARQEDLQMVAETVLQDILLKQGNPPVRAATIDEAYEMATTYIAEGGFVVMETCNIEGREYRIQAFPGNWKPMATDPGNPLKNGHPRRMMAYTTESLNYRTRVSEVTVEDDVPDYLQYRDLDGAEYFDGAFDDYSYDAA